MAIVTPEISMIKGTQILKVFWDSLVHNDTGLVVDYPGWADRNVQVFGTFGVGGLLTFEGSNDGTNWVTLHDITGALLSFNQAGLKMIVENCLYVRPSVTGDGTTDLTCIMIARGPK